MKNKIVVTISILMLMNTINLFAQLGKFGELNFYFGMLYEGEAQYSNTTLNVQGTSYYNIIKPSLFGGQVEYTRGYLLTPQTIFSVGLGYAHHKNSFNITDSNLEEETYGYKEPTIGARLQLSPHYITIPFRITFWGNTVRFQDGEITTAESASDVFGLDIGGKLLYTISSPKVIETSSNGELSDNDVYIVSLLNGMSENVNRLFLVGRAGLNMKLSSYFSMNIVVTYSLSELYDNDIVHFSHNGGEHEFKYYLTDPNSFRWGAGAFLSLSFIL